MEVGVHPGPDDWRADERRSAARLASRAAPDAGHGLVSNARSARRGGSDPAWRPGRRVPSARASGGHVQQVRAFARGCDAGRREHEEPSCAWFASSGPVSFSKLWIPSSPPTVPTERQKRSPKWTIRSGATPFTSG